MKYEAEDFEVLKSTVKHFMKNNPNSDMSVVMEYRPYPYNQTDDAYDALRFQDVRKWLIGFLCGICYDVAFKEARKPVVDLLREYGEPDNYRLCDPVKLLAWYMCDFMEEVSYWEWEQMRMQGESKADVVRRMYGAIKTSEGCLEKIKYFKEFQKNGKMDYMERMHLKEILSRLRKISGQEYPDVDEFLQDSAGPDACKKEKWSN